MLLKRTWLASGTKTSYFKAARPIRIGDSFADALLLCMLKTLQSGPQPRRPRSSTPAASQSLCVCVSLSLSLSLSLSNSLSLSRSLSLALSHFFVSRCSSKAKKHPAMLALSHGKATSQYVFCYRLLRCAKISELITCSRSTRDRQFLFLDQL